MKIRTDFVTNSSSSSFTILIGLTLTNGSRICFQAEGGIPEDRAAHFVGEAIASVSPKQLGAAKSVEELLSLLSEGVYDGYNDKRIFKKYVEQKENSSSDSSESEMNVGEEISTKTPRDFIATIRGTVSDMDQIEKITIGGYESNYADYNRVYTYDLKNDTYIGAEEGYPMREIDGGHGGNLEFGDLRQCEIKYVKESSLGNYNWDDWDVDDDLVIEDNETRYFYNRPRLGIDVFKVSEGESVFFGRYEQDCDEKNGAEDIEWIVLKVEKKRALVVSKYAIDRKDYGGQSWNQSSLRKWLNKTFMKMAFSPEEMAQIAPVTITSDGDYEFVDPVDMKTRKKENADYIFVLDSSEVKSYGVKNCIATPYAYKMGAHESVVNIGYGREHYVDFWVRDVEYNSMYVSVRPAMWINFDQTAVKTPSPFANDENIQSDIQGLTIASDEVVSYVGKEKDLVLPNGIKKIAERAFANTSVNSVLLPEGLRKISKRAFFECKNLCSINIPESVTSIQERTFRTCTSLKSITFPKGMKTIGESAFNSCSSLTEFVFPDLIKVISTSVLADCSSLEKVYIPDGATTISHYAFYECSALKEIRIPETVTIIRDFAFFGCKSLTDIYLSQNITSIGEDSFSTGNENTIIHAPLGSYAATYAEEHGYKVVYERSNFKDFEIEDGVLKGYYGDENNVIIPTGITAIGDYAFECIDELFSVIIPDGVKSIGDNVFQCCHALSEIIIPNSVTSIGEEAFLDCDTLASITIPGSVTKIGSDAFDGCNSLETVYLQSKEQKEKFKDCFGKAHLIIEKQSSVSTTPKVAKTPQTSATLISSSDKETTGTAEKTMKRPCSKSIDIPTSNLNMATKTIVIENGKLIRYAGNAATPNIPEGVTVIATGAFDRLENMICTDLPVTVQHVEKGAFRDCPNLFRVAILETLQSIEKGAFQNNSDRFYIDTTDGSYAARYGQENGIKVMTDGLFTKNAIMIKKAKAARERMTESKCAKK